LSANGAFLVVANPDNNTASFFDLRQDRNRRVAEVPVQNEPSGAAFMPNGRKAYIANTVSGTVSVINANIAGGAVGGVSKNIVVGTEPWGLCLAPNGSRLYVMNSRSNTVSVINTTTDTVVATISVSAEPRGCAVTNDGDDDDTDEALYVTHFISFLIPGKVDGFDDAKAGRVTLINAGTNTIVTTTAINPLPDSGFKAAGDALAGIRRREFHFHRRLSESIAEYRHQRRLGVSAQYGRVPNGPFGSMSTRRTPRGTESHQFSDANQTINMHRAVADQRRSRNCSLRSRGRSPLRIIRMTASSSARRAISSSR
jgi:YVTN family beta-propeller protein